MSLAFHKDGKIKLKMCNTAAFPEVYKYVICYNVKNLFKEILMKK